MLQKSLKFHKIIIVAKGCDSYYKGWIHEKHKSGQNPHESRGVPSKRFSINNFHKGGC